MKPVGQIRIDSSFPKSDLTPRILKRYFNGVHSDSVLVYSQDLIVVKKG